MTVCPALLFARVSRPEDLCRMEARRRSRSWCLLPATLTLVMLPGCVGALGSDREGEVLSEVITTSECSVIGSGTIETGSTFAGDVHDEGGIAVGAWSHETAGADMFVGDPASLICRLNGAIVADVEGTGTWNGVAGHRFRLHVQDRGEPGPPVIVPGTPTSLTVTASRTYSPSRWTDGTASFPGGSVVTIPAALPVTEGNAGNQWAWLTFTESGSGDEIRCRYRGGASTANPRTPADVAAGLSYDFSDCQRRGAPDPALVAGASIDASSLVLRVQHGSTRYPDRRCRAVTRVSVDLTVTPYVSIPREGDYYRLTIFDAADELVHFEDGDTTAGDIAVRLL